MIKLCALNAKLLFILAGCFSICYTTMRAQTPDTTTNAYMQNLQEHAALYRGEIELFYNPLIYKGHAYYISEEFVDADLYFNNRVYKSLRMRYDTYKDRFMVMTPDNQSMILNPEKIEKVKIYGKEIVNLAPSDESKLKPGFYLLLHNGNQLTVIGKEKSTKRALPSKVEYTFDKTAKYYLLHNEQYHTLKNKRSFTKLFPQHKKQLNKFTKDNHLDFRDNKEESLAALGAYCDKLINNP